MPESELTLKKDFFISYNKADRSWAEWIAWHLEEASRSVVIQAWDFGVACNFVVEVDRGIRECERVIAVLSPDYLASHFTQPEWAAYFAQDPTGEKRLLVPVRVRDCELAGLLASIVHFDIFRKSEADAKIALLDAVKLGRRKPESEPNFPGRKVVAKPRFPDALPEIWNVPHNRNPNFTEPSRQLDDLRATLISSRPAVLTQAVTGLGGLGKTQLATEYAYRYATDYSIIWWVRAEQSVTLAADYAAIAAKLGLEEKDAKEQPVVVAAVREALRQDWLLVFDNANMPEDLHDFLPQSLGHVLITSRNPAWSSVANRIPIAKWASSVSAEFLLRRTQQDDVASAMALAYELDGLPLALEQVVAFIEAASKTLAGYLALFREHRLDLLKRGRPSDGYPDTIATTWEISFQWLESESPGGAALLKLCAFFASEDIPRDAIAAGAEFLPQQLRAVVGDALAFDDAVAALRRYSLVENVSEMTLSQHRLVQAVIRDRLDEGGRSLWAEAAVKIVNEVYPNEAGDISMWQECNRLLSHAIATAEHAEQIGVGLEESARLFNQIGNYTLARAEYVTAKTAFERALRIIGASPESNQLSVATYVNNLARVLHEMGELPAAKTAFERALQIDEKILGPNDPKVSVVINNLGLVLRDLGDLPGARAAIERGLNIDQEVFGPDHLNVATSLNNLGSILNDLGEFPAARTAFERAIRIGEKTLGPNHPQMTALFNNLGGVLFKMGRLREAKVVFERVLHISEITLGKDHPHVAIVLTNLGALLFELGDLQAAKVVGERSLSIFRRTLGDDHPKTRVVAENLSLLGTQ